MREQRRAMVVDGLIAGAAAYAVVAVFFIVVNVVMGRPPFLTAALLGEGVFAGLRDPGAVLMDPPLMIAFNGVQLVLMLGFAFFVAWLVHETELHPNLWYLAFFVFLSAVLIGFAAVLVLTLLAGSLLSPWLVGISTLLGAVAVVSCFAIRHRALRRSIDRTFWGSAA